MLLESHERLKESQRGETTMQGRREVRGSVAAPRLPCSTVGRLKPALTHSKVTLQRRIRKQGRGGSSRAWFTEERTEKVSMDE